MNRRIIGRGLLALTLAGSLALSGPAVAQTAPPSAPATEPLQQDIERLREEMEALRGELRAIRELLQRPPGQPARTVARVSVAGAPLLGKAEAPVTVVEFSDYQCPFCRRFFDGTLRELKSAYIDTGKVRYAFRDFPIDRIHPLARKAAEAARCAGDQGRYWEMHDTLFRNQEALERADLTRHAQGIGVDAVRFDDCLARDLHAPSVQRDLDDGVAAGVRGTPAFFIGRTRADSTVEGVLIVGAQPLAAFRQEIDRALAEK